VQSGSIQSRWWALVNRDFSQNNVRKFYENNLKTLTGPNPGISYKQTSYIPQIMGSVQNNTVCRSEVLMAVKLTLLIFWVVKSCGLEGVNSPEAIDSMFIRNVCIDLQLYRYTNSKTSIDTKYFFVEPTTVTNLSTQIIHNCYI
jgi:hypothetical protein